LGTRTNAHAGGYVRLIYVRRAAEQVRAKPTRLFILGDSEMRINRKSALPAGAILEMWPAANQVSSSQVIKK